MEVVELFEVFPQFNAVSFFVAGVELELATTLLDKLVYRVTNQVVVTPIENIDLKVEVLPDFLNPRDRQYVLYSDL